MEDLGNERTKLADANTKIDASDRQSEITKVGRRNQDRPTADQLDDTILGEPREADAVKAFFELDDFVENEALVVFLLRMRPKTTKGYNIR